MANENVPLVNGYRYSYVSIELGIDGTRIYGVKAINYKTAQKKGKVAGTSPLRLGRTRGKAEPEASIEIYKREFQSLVDKLMQGQPNTVGIHDIIIPSITVTYAETSGEVVTDTLTSITLDEIDQANQDNTDATSVKLALDIMNVLWGGKRAFGDLSSSGSGA